MLGAGAARPGYLPTIGRSERASGEVGVNLWESAAVLGAGMVAGGINALVGSGTLITFPTLVAVGLPPVVANVTNTVGLVPGSVAGAYGYRRELEGQRDRIIRLCGASMIGALVGGGLLLGLPPGAFKVIVPALIGVALVLVIMQTRLNAWLKERREQHPPHGGIGLWLGVFGAGVYGGYFGAAQGVVLLGLLGIFLDDGIQRINATKNVLSAIVNAVAAVLFIVVSFFHTESRVDWTAAILVAAGATIGGLLGGAYGRRIPAPVLRGVIVVVGVVAIVKLILD